MFLYQLIRLWPLSKFLRKIVLQPRLLQFRLQLTHHQPEAYLCSLYRRRDFGIFQDIPFLQFMLARATFKELGKSLLRRRHWLRVRNLVGYPSIYSKGRWAEESRGEEYERGCFVRRVRLVWGEWRVLRIIRPRDVCAPILPVKA